MRYHVENFGCRATQAEGTALEEGFRARGYQRAGDTAAADLVVINTCTVTASADQQARQYVRHIHRRNSAARILVTGCYAQRAPEELAALPGVTWVVGNSHKAEIPAVIERALPAHGRDFIPVARLGSAKVITENICARTPLAATPVFEGEGGRTRPTLKIQDGCNNRCAYCIIPFVRGRSRSLPPADVIAQITRLEAAGTKEVVLSGVDLGSYGRDVRPRASLVELTARILAETSIPLVRFSSVEPEDLTDEFLSLVASTQRIARHLHAPLQSGSDRVLRRMRRWYNRAEYAERIEAAASALPNLGLGADVMVGFPGETEEDFRATYGLVEQLPFTYLHVFGYSPRPGTAAAGLPARVPPRVSKERNRALRLLAAEKGERFRRAQLHCRLRVVTLATTNPDGTRNALSENYLKVRLPATSPPNRLLTVRVTRVDGNELWAEPERATLN
ncbi:MAG: tRNA (N(6)-L-threonylcarbamoyladenosine(37)-C(2))-methylthiotransferase MtaB [Terriglobia bacterium]